MFDHVAQQIAGVAAGGTPEFSERTQAGQSHSAGLPRAPLGCFTGPKTYRVWIGLLLLALCGCMHTVIGRGDHSPHNCYRLWVTSHGAPAKAYVDKSKKKIWISIEGGDATNPTVAAFRVVTRGRTSGWPHRYL